MKQKLSFITLFCFISVKATQLDNCSFSQSGQIVTLQEKSLKFECYLGAKFKSCELVKNEHSSDQQCLYEKRAGTMGQNCPSHIQFESDVDHCILNLINISTKGKIIAWIVKISMASPGANPIKLFTP